MKSAAKPEIKMTCPYCKTRCQGFGKHRNGLRRFRCAECRRTFTEPHRLMLDTMYVSEEKALLVPQLLIEGNSIRSTMRISGVAQSNQPKLLLLPRRPQL